VGVPPPHQQCIGANQPTEEAGVCGRGSGVPRKLKATPEGMVGGNGGINAGISSVRPV
jgi:hypothetical protein